MSIISATSTNISISTFIRGFHPDFPNSGDTDISADTWGNAAMYPLPTTIGSPASQIQWSELRNKKWFQQNIIVSGGTGTISVVTPSTQALYSYNVYQIEGEGKKLFKNVEGDANTIMGLPIKKIKEYLENYK